MLAIVGGKGGCGKTTTALGLARAFAAAGGRPLVVDADCDMPNLHTMAETDRNPGLAAYADGAPTGLIVHRSQAYPGVEIVPAGGATGCIDPGTVQRLARVAGRTIVDCPAGATDAVAAPIRATEGAVVVSTAEPASLEDAAKTARMVRALDARLFGAVVTRTDAADQNRAFETEFPEQCPVLATVPEIDGRVLADRTCRAAYSRLARRLGERNI